MKHSTLLFLFFLFVNGCVWAQIMQPEEKESGSKFTILLSHAHLSKGINEATGKKQWQVLPAWCFDYDYILNNKWGVGLHNDIITETYEVESYDHTTIQRTRPISSSVVGSYKFSPHWVAMLGAGGEFAKEKNFFLTSISIEYEYKLPKNFELVASACYELKWNAYDTYLVGIGISKAIR